MNKFIRSFYILVIILTCISAISEKTYAQPIIGIKTIPGNYTSIEMAIAALNSNGVGTGGVTFNVAAGHIETFSVPTAGTLTATGTSANPIVFQKSGIGANPLITAAPNGTTTSTDGIIKIAGGDYITFDGINLQENPLNTTTTMQMEWGYALVKKNANAPFDGCQYVNIKNTAISLAKSNVNSAGIYTGNHIGTSTTTLAITDPADAMNYCKFYSNIISNVYIGIRIGGYNAASPYALYDQNNEVGVEGGNSITNYGGAGTTAYGVYAIYQNNIKIAYNTINGGTGQTSTLYGIYTSTGNNSNVDIYGNTITVTPNITTSSAYGISNSMGGSGTNNTVNIYNNTLENCTFTSATSATFYCLYQSASVYTVNIYGNILRNNTKPGTGIMYLLYNSAGAADGISNVYNNSVYNNTNSGTGSLYSIYVSAGNTSTSAIYGNSIYNNSGGSSIVYGLYTTGVSTTANVFNNNISNLLTTNTSGVVHGIYAASAVNIYLYNNFVSDLKATASTNSNAVIGINIISGTNLGLYYNTVFLNAVSSSASSFGTSGIYTATPPVLEMKNNIIVNESTPGPTSGLTVAYRRNGSTLTSYSNGSNNNVFYAGASSASRLIFYDGTNSDLTIAAYKTRVSPRDAGSVTEDVPFINTTAAPYDIHVRTDFPTQTEGGGIPVYSPVNINSDYDGDIRNFNYPDIGADEFIGIGYDITPPSISYSLITNTSLTSNRTFSNVAINDGSGVNTAPGTAPRLYYKRASDDNTFVNNTSASIGWKYAEASGTVSPFSFSIDYSKLYGGTGVIPGDVIQYFVIAQDLGVPTVGIYSGAFTNIPLSVNLTPAAFPITGTIFSYAIVPSIAGIVTVGSGGIYPSLTGDGGLFADINSKVVTSNITAQIISDLPETGANALNQWIEDGSGNYTLTIQPDAAVLRTISGSYPDGLIRLNGADRVTIDGRFADSGQYLKIVNTATSGAIAAIQIISLGIDAGSINNTIRNCILNTGHHTATSTAISVGGAVNSTGSSNHNIQILNNSINRAYQGIYVGSVSAGMSNGLVISGNLIGSTGTDTIAFRGITLTGVNAPEITGNEIYNMSVYTAVNNAGIDIGSYVPNALITRNKIYGLRSTNSGGNGSYGINISATFGTLGTLIANNLIYDISTDGEASSVTNNPFGIRINGGTNHKVYHNSVNLFGSFLASTSTGADFSAPLIISSSSVTGVDIRNNIFSNSMTGPSASTKAYAIYAVSGVVFGTINKNNYYASGTYGVLGYFASDKTTLAAWKLATGQDLYSQNVNPMFTSNTNLHINSGLTPTLLESGGDMITEVNTDYDMDVRPGPVGSVNGGATKPDIGADEFDGVPAVSMTLVSSTVTQNNFGNLFKNTTNNEIICVQIVTSGEANPIVLQNLAISTVGTTDLADIRNAKVWYTGMSSAFAAVTQYGSTLTTITPTFNINGNMPLLTGTNYFWLTFDVASNPTGGNHVDARCTELTIDGTPVIPAETNPAGFRTILGALAGIYNIGASQNFTTITEAVTALNAVGISAPVTFNLTDPDYSTGETFPIVINQVDGGSPVNTVTIKPAASVTTSIIGTAASIIKLNGADNIIIEGSNSEGTDRSLTIRNDATSTSTTVIWVASLGAGLGAVNNSIRNCNITAGSKTVTSMFGLFAGGTTISTSGTGAENNNLTIQNNVFSKAYYGICAHGAASPGANLGLTISKNIIGSDITDNSIGKYGLDITNADGAVISGNKIYNFVGTASNPTGMLIGAGFINGSILSNMIHNLFYTGTTGYGGKGIDISTGVSPSNVIVANNVIRDLKGDGYTSLTSDAIVGIRILGTSGGFKIYYNSINLSGNTDRSSANLSSALYIASTASAVELKNNVLCNSIVNNTNASSKAYTIYNAAPVAVLTAINYNDYYPSGIQGILGYQGADMTSMDAWRTITGQDVNSFSANPFFTADSNLRPQTGSPLLAAGNPVPEVATDVLGISRSTSSPSIGSYETTEGAAAFPLSVNVTDGWNMVSVPGTHPTNMNVDTWWSFRNPLASVYKWAAGYVAVTNATPKEGYWMLHNGTRTYNTGDEWPAGGIQIVAHDPIPVTTGWNMIGGYDGTPLVSALTTSPPGLIVPGTVYGWNGSYANATNLNPGYGYWVLINAPGGFINIPAGTEGGVLAKEDNKETWGKIIVTDASGKKFTLYSVDGEVKVNLDSYQLPPLPPAGCFDVRFGTGRKAEYLNKGSQTIEMAGMEYPVTVMADNIAIKIQDETGRIINKRIKAGEEVKISDSNVSKLLVSENLIPDVYSLDQNYPNPFNPGTLIQFTLPEDVKNVSLIVYDALGQKVTELVSGAKEAGYYQYQWNASNLASGLYIYQLRTEKFVSTKKMMLLK